MAVPPCAYSVFQLAIHRNQGCTGAVYNKIGCIPEAVGVWALQSDDDGRKGKVSTLPGAVNSDVCMNCGKAGSKACCTSCLLERSG